MSITLILILMVVVGWAWVLGRPILTSLLDRGKRDPIGQFNKQYASLGRMAGAAPGAGFSGPRHSANTANRRRTFLALVMAVAASLVLAVLFGGIFIAQHLLLDVALVGFLIVAARAGSVESEQRSKVSYIESEANSAQSPYLRAVGER